MRRLGFILGFYSIIAQVLILRDIMSTFSGSEILLSIGLFGWMIAVALGAYSAGKSQFFSILEMMCAGTLLLPGILILLRLSPMAIVSLPGEAIPITKAAALSVVATALPGFISGYLFTAISRVGWNASHAIAQTYLFEGLGAAVGGVAITLLAGSMLSTLTIAFLLPVVVIPAMFVRDKYNHLFWMAPLGIVAGITFIILVPRLEAGIAAVRYEPFQIIDSFDTPYSHQTVLWNYHQTTIMTDNRVELTEPDLNTIEDLTIWPLLYNPDAHNILITGPPRQLNETIRKKAGVEVHFLDPRPRLDRFIRELNPAMQTSIIRRDPVSYFRGDVKSLYDVIIINGDSPGTFSTASVYSRETLSDVVRHISPSGVLIIRLPSNSDYQVRGLKTKIAFRIYQTTKSVFPNVAILTGDSDLIVASTNRELPIDSRILKTRLERLGDIWSNTLHNRIISGLNPLHRDQLLDALNQYDAIATIDRPAIIHDQLLFDAQRYPTDRKVLSVLIGKPYWLILLPLAITGFWLYAMLTNRQTNRYALYLYAIAGFLSLVIELVAIYVYQATAGSLYRDMAALFGIFMLGLAVGTWNAMRSAFRVDLAPPSLGLLLTAVVLYTITFRDINTIILLPYYCCFLFVTALATGTLFVAATNRYYLEDQHANRGYGYAAELAGSAVAALCTASMLLPVIGVTWILFATIAMIIISIVGAVLTTARTMP